MAHTAHALRRFCMLSMVELMPINYFMAQSPHVGMVWKVSPNAVYKLGGEVENIVKNHNYKAKDERKAIGNAVLELIGERYPMARQLNHQTFAQVHQNLVNMDVSDPRLKLLGDRKQPKHSYLKSVLHAVSKNPGISVRTLAVVATAGIFEHVNQSMSRRCRMSIHADDRNLEHLLVTFPPKLSYAIRAPQDVLYLPSKFAHGIRRHLVFGHY
ncbi:hypothetical protein TNCV_3268861 [Trichonephila clavipes]|nr:hypothetical protein TNCV_3268861 [Trichonephila clavipes]